MAANASQRPSRTTVPPTATRQDPAADTTTLPDGSVRPLLDTDEAGGNILRADMVGQGIVHYDNGAGLAPGRGVIFTLSLTAIGWHPLGIYTVIWLPLLLLSASVTCVAPRA